MGTNTHAGSKKNLLGEHPDPELVKDLSNELQVTKNTRLASSGIRRKTKE